jgi:hypothetical protein
LVAAEAGLARLGTVAIDGTKIPANASIDANRGEEWLEAQVRLLVTEAQRLDAAEEVASTAARSSDDGDGDDDSDGERGCGIAAIARSGSARPRRRLPSRRGDANVWNTNARRWPWPVAGVPRPAGRWSGGSRDGRHRLAEAQAHLAREIAAHQAKLDRHAAILAAGRRPWDAGRK